MKIYNQRVEFSIEVNKKELSIIKKNKITDKKITKKLLTILYKIYSPLENSFKIVSDIERRFVSVTCNYKYNTEVKRICLRELKGFSV